MEMDRNTRDREIIVLSEIRGADGRETYQLLRVRYSGVIETVASKNKESLESYFERYNPSRNQNHLYEMSSMVVSYPVGMKVCKFEGTKVKEVEIVKEGEVVHVNCAIINPKIIDEVDIEFSKL